MAVIYTTALAVVLAGVLCGWEVKSFSLMAPMDMHHLRFEQSTSRSDIPVAPHHHIIPSTKQPSTAKLIKDQSPHRWLAISRHFRRIMDVQNNPVMFDRFK